MVVVFLYVESFSIVGMSLSRIALFLSEAWKCDRECSRTQYISCFHLRMFEWSALKYDEAVLTVVHLYVEASSSLTTFLSPSVCLLVVSFF